MNKLTIYFVCIFTTNLFSISNQNIITIKSEFHKKVVETLTYKKRYKTYLKNHCPTEEIQCYNNKIPILKNWNNTKRDTYIHLKLKSYQNNNKLIKKSWKKISKKLIALNLKLDKSQFISTIDLSKQLYILVLWNNVNKSFHFIGTDFISTGDISCEVNVKSGEDHYFETPTGIFKVKSGWRSVGKKLKDNYTMPYGKKDRYVYYFGKQKGMRYNSFDENKKKIAKKADYDLISDHLEFAMHAHKSYNVLGSKASHGCIRLSNELNLFLDNNYVLHKNVYIDNKWQQKYIIPPQSSSNSHLSGEYLIVFDKI